MDHRHRNMYKLTGLSGWLRFGYSPGWIDRSPTGLPPTAQWLMQSGFLPQYMQWLQSQVPPTVPPTTQSIPPSDAPMTQTPTPFATPFQPTYTKEQEKQMFEQQAKMLESQLEAVRKRIIELGDI